VAEDLAVAPLHSLDQAAMRCSLNGKDQVAPLLPPVADGIAFGTFLGTSQSFIAESVPASGIGTWLGVYSAAGAHGETFRGVVMGTIAAAFGGLGVFRVSAVILAAGAVISVASLRRERGATGKQGEVG
jgi:hypothetical protein